jgi:AcrR family transcriptional regulator
MNNFTGSGTRVVKSQHTRQKIFDAAKELLAEGGYDQLSVRNICNLAQVSNGSFYHFFHSKDDMLSEFLMQDQKDRTEDNSADLPLLDFIVMKYMRHVDDCQKMGIDFTANYYNPKNQSFNIYTRRPGDYPIDLYGPKLAQAQSDGYVRNDLPVTGIVEDIRSIVIGNIFIWCSSRGMFNLKGNLERMLRQYLATVFTDKYYESQNACANT